MELAVFFQIKLEQTVKTDHFAKNIFSRYHFRIIYIMLGRSVTFQNTIVIKMS